MAPVEYTPGFGTKPEDTAWGPYAYGGTNHDGTGGGFQGGFGIQSGMAGTKEGWHGGSHLLRGNGFLGLNHEGAIGAGGSAQVARLEGGWGERGKGPAFSADADAFGANFDGWVNPDRGAALGASAYIVQGSATAGNIGTGARDEEARFGLGAGVGGAGRLHWEDADGDGRREYGFGADIGPVSFDLKTEDPLMTMARMSPLGMLAGPLADRFLPKDFNLTESVGNGISNGARAIGSGVSSAARAVGNAASTVGSGIANGARAVGNGIANGARAIGGAASAVGSGVLSGARAVGSGIASGASAVGSGIVNGASAVGSGIANGARAVGSGIANGARAVGSGIASGASAVGRGVSSAFHRLTGW